MVGSRPAVNVSTASTGPLHKDQLLGDFGSVTTKVPEIQRLLRSEFVIQRSVLFRTMRFLDGVVFARFGRTVHHAVQKCKSTRGAKMYEITTHSWTVEFYDDLADACDQLENAMVPVMCGACQLPRVLKKTFFLGYGKVPLSLICP